MFHLKQTFDCALILYEYREGAVLLLSRFGYKPVNQYLPPRPRRAGDAVPAAATPARATEESLDTAALPPMLRWLDRVLSR